MNTSYKTKRAFLPEDLKINSWEDIKPYFESLEKEEISSVIQLKKWLKKLSELESVLDEDLAWRYIKMNCNTEDKELADSFRLFVSQIDPEINRYSNLLNKKLADIELTNELKESEFQIMMRSVKNEIELFRDENVPIIAELQEMEQEYGQISSLMMIDHDGKEITLQEASNYLRSTNREDRKEVFQKITSRRLQDSDVLDKLLNTLIEKRHKIAQNAGFENFRDFKYQALGRFDYTVKDVHEFHKAIATCVKPIVDNIHKVRKDKLGLDQLKPYDLAVDIDLKDPLKPFETSDELLNKSIDVFDRLSPDFGKYLTVMKEGKFLDLEARKGKAPGGFNYPLHESNIPFIYMNATGNLRDLETLMHEGGHAIHSFLCADLELVAFKETPSEVAELASMSMELISMDYWSYFFNDEDLKRAKRSQLEGVLDVLPWVATIDKFQDWMYTHPNHSTEDRKQAWLAISKEFGSSVVDWTGFEQALEFKWQNQLHIYEVPFYYIEYAMAQLGAIAVWKNYKENPKLALDQYQNALKLGYTKTIPEIYEAAGIRFDFSVGYIQELMSFVEAELKALED